MNHPESSPTAPELEQQAEESGQADSVKRSKLPDFKPLGAIRDYFTEQMKQDQLR
jgi:hypothetical protein